MAKDEDIYKDIPAHTESEKDEGSDRDEREAKADMKGPIILQPSTYVEEDKALEEEKRKRPKTRRK